MRRPIRHLAPRRQIGQKDTCSIFLWRNNCLELWIFGGQDFTAFDSSDNFFEADFKSAQPSSSVQFTARRMRRTIISMK